MKIDTQSATGQDIQSIPRHQQILQETGPATGLITGINHLVMFAEDMNAAVRFYRDILGFRVVRTQRFVSSAEGLRKSARHTSGAAVSKNSDSSVSVQVTLIQVFFEMGNGELFSLYEAPNVNSQPDAPVSSVLWPEEGKARTSKPSNPQKMDHLAFNVNSHEEVVWFKEHLLKNGVDCSDVTERKGVNNTHRFISSIYFFDPSGNPLEISSFNQADPAWESYDFSDWFMDEQPVESLLVQDSEGSPALVPNWVGEN